MRRHLRFVGAHQAYLEGDLDLGGMSGFFNGDITCGESWFSVAWLAPSPKFLPGGWIRLREPRVRQSAFASIISLDIPGELLSQVSR